MNGSAFFSLAALIVTGIVIADIIANPTGTQAAGNAIGGIWKTSSNALLGRPS